ncbi:hypothetical protein PFICI_11357 [Pestalotiopsis fici W106-1]|uniref:Uncharacterized protein n=1 Tax=Pestalotiopsis fici (strain W106-1 / CGMCC3.15140) TaxID=1229662 RepID=W3WUC2_PESFW|nr:uncharacterized protein PFICI_11357 [Pestalotiopsis fici W106-1]ETS77483.1 hypothetical protein PFICI_11357 [Pestalotiopsis fici W106-1]
MPGQQGFTSISSNNRPGQTPSVMLESYLASELTVTERLAMGVTSFSSGNNTSNRDTTSGQVSSSSQTGQGGGQN